MVIVLGALSGKCRSSPQTIASYADVLRLVTRSSPCSWGGTCDEPKDVCVTMDEQQLQNAVFWLVWHTEMSSVFRTGQSMNFLAWKLVKWAKFVLVLTNTHMLKNKESKRITSQCGKKKNLKGKKKKTQSKKKKTHGKMSSIPRGQFNSYFFCREVLVILFAVGLFFL